MTSTKLGAAAALLGLAGCADVLDLAAYEPSGGAGGSGGSTTTSAGGSGGSTTTSASGGGSGGSGTTTSAGGSGGSTTTSAGGSGGSTTTTEVPTECEPGTTEPCYGGPPLTEGVGACKAGARTCDAAGQWGACAGEVSPTIESCVTTAVDESCDNLSTCSGAFRWSRRFGGALDQVPGLPAVAADGGLIVTGYAAGALDFGGGPLPEGGGLDVFVARLDRDGKHVWSKRFGGAGDEAGVAVALDVGGNILLAGNTNNAALDLGGGPLPNAGISDLVIAKLTPDGAHVWSHTWGTAANDGAGAIAVDAAGDVFVAASTQSADAGDIVLLKLSGQDGSTLWSKPFPATGAQAVTGLAVAPDGDVILAGYGPGGPNFGGGATPALGGSDAFAARFDTAGAHVWSHSYGGAGSDYASAVAVDASGNAVFIGTTDGVFAFGAPAPTATTAGSVDVAVWRVQPDGATIWGQLRGDAASQFGFGLAIDALGNIVLAGTFAGTITFDAPHAAADPFDRFVAKLDPAGAPIWSRRFPGGASAYPRVAVDPLGNVVYTSLLNGTTDLGGGPLTSTSLDIVAGGFAP